MFGTFNSVLGIGVSVFLKDEFTANANRINNTFNNLSTNTNNKIRGQLTTLRNFGTGLAVVSGGLVMGMRSAVMETARFEEILYKTKAVAGMTGSDLEFMKKQAIALSYQFPNTATDIASGFLEIAKAGIVGRAEITAFQKAVLSFAGGADIPIGGEEGATNMMLRMMAGYQLPLSAAQSVSDILSQVANSTTVDPKQIYEAFQYSQDVLHTFGVGLTESAALIGTAAQAGLVGSRAGIGIAQLYKNIAQTVARPTKNDKAGFKALGLDPKDLTDGHGNLLKIDQVLLKIQTRMKGMGDIQRALIEQDFMGVRGGRMGSDLGRFLFGEKSDGQVGKSYSEVLGGAQNSGGAAMKVIEARMASPLQKLEMFTKGWFDFKTAFADAIIPVLLPLLSGATKVFRAFAEFAKTPIGKYVVIAGAIAIFTTLISGLSMAFMAMRGLAAMSGAAGIGSLFGAKGGILTVFQMLWNNMRGFGTFLTATGLWGGPFMRFLPLWATALRGLPVIGPVIRGIGSIVALLGPWGWALAAAAGALLLLYNYSDKIKNWVDGIGSAIGTAFQYVGAFFTYLINLATNLTPGGGSFGQFSQSRAIWNSEVENIRFPNLRKNIPPPQTSSGSTQMETMMAQLITHLKGEKKTITIQVVNSQGKIITTQEIDAAHAKAIVKATGIK